ncbi:MAG: hypothetical protein HY817_02160 [Candidatus Abawacabacteria bacterium]|nr:hypothetical protein [Candidatus Abawacabacteria bacterium]
MIELVDCHVNSLPLLAKPDTESALVYLEGAFVDPTITKEKLLRLQQMAGVDIIGVTGRNALRDGRRYWCKVEAELKDWRPAPMPLNEADIVAAIEAVLGLESKLRKVYRKSVWLGYSQGAIVALLAQMEAPNQLSNVVAICPGTVTNRHFHRCVGCFTSLVVADEDLYCDGKMREELASSLGVDAILVNQHRHAWSERLACVAVKEAAQYLNHKL